MKSSNEVQIDGDMKRVGRSPLIEPLFVNDEDHSLARVADTLADLMTARRTLNALVEDINERIDSKCFRSIPENDAVFRRLSKEVKRVNSSSFRLRRALVNLSPRVQRAKAIAEQALRVVARSQSQVVPVDRLQYCANLAVVSGVSEVFPSPANSYHQQSFETNASEVIKLLKNRSTDDPALKRVERLLLEWHEFSLRANTIDASDLFLLEEEAGTIADRMRKLLKHIKAKARRSS